MSKCCPPAQASCCCDLSPWLSPPLFKALGDPTRGAILVRLAESGRALTVTEAASCCPVDLSVVSRHLRVLRDAGIVEAERRGREILHRVRYSELVGLLRGLADALETCCPDGACEEVSRDE